MKGRIIALLMVMVMVFGMGVVSYAAENEVKYYKATGKICNVDTGGDTDSVSNAKLEYSADYLVFTFFINDEEHDLVLTRTRENGEGHIEYDGEYRGILYGYYNAFLFSNDNKHVSIKFESENFYMNGALDLVEYFPNKKPSQISTPFTGTAISDREEYTLALAGYFEKELTDGTHVLTPEEINAQTISIVAYNKANGVKRVMTQSTIEEMSVTVSQNEVTQYVIRGRVQTSGGKLDRYTAVINN